MQMAFCKLCMHANACKWHFPNSTPSFLLFVGALRLASKRQRHAMPGRCGQDSEASELWSLGGRSRKQLMITFECNKLHVRKWVTDDHWSCRMQQATCDMIMRQTTHVERWVIMSNATNYMRHDNATKYICRKVSDRVSHECTSCIASQLVSYLSQERNPSYRERPMAL